MLFLRMGLTIMFFYVLKHNTVFYLQGKSFVVLSCIFTSLMYLLYYFPKGRSNKGPQLSDLGQQKFWSDNSESRSPKSEYWPDPASS